MGFIEGLIKYILMISPFLLLGLLVAGVIHAYLNVEKLKGFINNGKTSDVFKAAFFGIPLPLCSCAVIPSAVTLRKSGVKNGPTSSFLISTPETGVDSILVTYGLMDLPMTIIRPFAAFVSASVAGIFQNIFNDKEYSDNEVKKSCCKKSKSSKNKNFLAIFRFGFIDLLDDISNWLAVGIIIGACIDYFIPANLFLEYNGLFAKILILGVGIPMYVCASATTPIAAALMVKGLSPGAALIFLLVGPATNVSNILVLQKYIGKRGVLINILSISIVTLAFSFLVDYLYISFQLPLNYKISSHHHGFSMLEYVASISFVVLLLRSLVYNNIISKK